MNLVHSKLVAHPSSVLIFFFTIFFSYKPKPKIYEHKKKKNV